MTLNKKMKQWRSRNESHEELIAKGFSLKPQKNKKQCKYCILEIRTGRNGRKYYKTRKMTGKELAFNKAYDRRKKLGKEVFFQYEPIDLFMEMMSLKIDYTVTKDKQGNVTVKFSRIKSSKTSWSSNK